MKFRKKMLLTLFACMLAGMAAAQPGGGSGPGSGNPVPITGIEILLGLGGLYGAKKILERRK